MNHKCPCIVFCRQDKFQVLEFYSNMKIIRMMVEVTNVPSRGRLAEDAHQAMLEVSIPEALRYSGVRSAVSPLTNDFIFLVFLFSTQALNAIFPSQTEYESNFHILTLGN